MSLYASLSKLSGQKLKLTIPRGRIVSFFPCPERSFFGLVIIFGCSKKPLCGLLRLFWLLIGRCMHFFLHFWLLKRPLHALFPQEHGVQKMIVAIPRGPIVWESGEALRGRIERSARVTGAIIVCPWVHSAVEEPFPGGVHWVAIASKLLYS
jgi:hypothetical protein